MLCTTLLPATYTHYLIVRVFLFFQSIRTSFFLLGRSQKERGGRKEALLDAHSQVHVTLLHFILFYYITLIQ